MTGTISTQFLSRLEAQRENLITEAEAWTRSLPEGKLAPEQARRYQQYVSDLRDLAASINDTRSELARMGNHALKNTGADAMTYGRLWAERVSEKLRRSMGGGLDQRAVISGSIDVPQLVEVDVIPAARPARLIDLFSNRIALDGNAFEYFVQIARDNKATAVADHATKPTSTLTVEAHEDRCRVVAHLSEPVPLRIWYDIEQFVTWLNSEMVGGVLDALEAQIVSGDGVGENMLGLLATPGTTQVPFDTDPITTLRSGVTALQVLGEVPTGWALHPADAELIDLTRWGTSGGFLSGGYENDTGSGFGTSSNVFGTAVKRVVSPSVPQGTAILGDFSKLRLYVREEAHMDIDASGVLFTKNEFIARGEGRFGIGVLRPSAFAVCDLSA